MQQEDADKVFLRWRKAHLYEMQGDKGKALHELEAAIDANPNLRESYVMCAELLERMGKLMLALDFWQKALNVKVETKGYQRREDVWSEEFINEVERKLA